MKIPYVIDSQHHRLADVLNEVIRIHAGRPLDVATASFTVGGFAPLHDGPRNLGSFRLLLGAEPASGRNHSAR